jgi:hypothetical protein
MSMYAVLGVSRELPSGPSSLHLAGFEEQLDPELVSLPDPPRAHRTLTLVTLALAALAAVAMIFALRHDISYALASRTPVNLGDLRSVDTRELDMHENRFVRAEAPLGAAGGIRYERLLAADTFRAVPVAGRTDVWIELRVPAGEESGRWEPPRQFAGRLVHFENAGPRLRGLASAIEHANHEVVAGGAWLLVDGENPANLRWAMVLALALLAFAVWHITATARMLRKVRA